MTWQPRIRQTVRLMNLLETAAGRVRDGVSLSTLLLSYFLVFLCCRVPAMNDLSRPCLGIVHVQRDGWIL